MTFMSGDSKRGVPQFVEVGWLVSTPNIVNAENELDKKFRQYSPAWMDGIKGIQAIMPRHTRPPRARMTCYTYRLYAF